MREQIYLDHGASTPVHPLVLEKMLPFFTERYGNPSSIHSHGRKTKIPLEDARAIIAKALNTKPPRIVFTSGGSEADHLAIVGAALGNQAKGKHLIISEIEHAAILQATDFLKHIGFEISIIPVDQQGTVKLDVLKKAIRNDTTLISVMFANNEIGTIQPIEEIGLIAREKGILFHTDAVQAFPVMKIDLAHLPIDLLTISSHKINGPKGIGALYIREGVAIQPVMGGSQERSRRGGTENVPGIIGFGEASRILMESIDDKVEKLRNYRETMIRIFEQELEQGDFTINGHPSNVIPSNLNISFKGVNSHTMIMALDMKGIAISGGSACASGSVSTSRIIKALKLPDEIAAAAVRISFGYGNTEEQVIRAAKEIVNVVKSKKR